MDRRQAGDDLWRKKFEVFGLSEHFIYVGRDWTSVHGHRCIVKCKKCGTVFASWNVESVFKKRSETISCPNCRMMSNGKLSFPKSALCDEAMEYYAQGHSASETAEKFNVEVWQVVNAATLRKVSNGRSTHQMIRQKKIGNAHRHRSKIFNSQYDPLVTLNRLIERDGLRCAICGGMCNPKDRRWNGRYGPTSPTIDHIKPMSKGGGHTWDNVQIAHAICNSKKGANYEAG